MRLGAVAVVDRDGEASYVIDVDVLTARVVEITQAHLRYLPLCVVRVVRIQFVGKCH